MSVNRRRLMLNGKSALAVVPSCERRAGAIRYVLPTDRPHPRFRETTVLAEAGW
jgi:hypothetical protein